MTSVLGVDVGGTQTKWAAVRNNDVVDYGALATPAAPEMLGEELARLLGDGTQVERVGVALAAVIDQSSGRALIAPNLPASWTRLPVAEVIADAVGRPVRVCNDARAFALAEATMGAGRGHRTVACITLGTGVGGGVVIDGRPQLGRDARAGEFGHLLVNPGGARCACGARGCLEAYAGGRAMVAAVRERGGIDLATPQSIGIAAAAEDPLARWAIRRAAQALGRALAQISIVLAPDVVIVGGGLSGAFELMRPHVERALATASSVVPTIRLRRSQLGNHAGAIGAALWETTP
jgi:glucokinase